MEQNAVPGAIPAPVAERTGEVRPAVWLRFQQVSGAKEILERTGRLPGVLRFKVPQTIHAFRIPEGQTYRIVLPDGRNLLMAEGVNELDPPAAVVPGDEIRLRFVNPGRATSATDPADDAFNARIDAIWSDPSLTTEPLLQAGRKMAAVQEEVLDELDDDALEPLEEMPATAEESIPASSAPTIEPANLPYPFALSFGIRIERHPGLLSRLLGTSSHKEGSR